MRLSECAPGMTVMFGNINDLREGKKGEEVKIKAIGFYTLVRDEGCPDMKAVEVTDEMKAKHGHRVHRPTAKRIVVERQRDHTDRHRKRTTKMRYDDVCSPQKLMLTTEYEAKRAARESVEAAILAYNKKGRELLDQIGELLAPHVNKLPNRVRASSTKHYRSGKRRGAWRHSKDVSVEVTVEVDNVLSEKVLAQLPKATQRKLEPVVKAYLAWLEEPDPSIC